MERDCKGLKRDANLKHTGATGNQSKQKPGDCGDAATTIPGGGGSSMISLAVVV